MAILETFSDMTRKQYAWTSAVFLRKYKAKEPFELSNRKTVVFEILPVIIDAIENRSKSIDDLILLSTDCKSSYMFKSILLNKEFIGKDIHHRVSNEDKVIESLCEQIDEAKEIEAYSSIKIKIKGKIYEVSTVKSTPKSNPPNAKSDFHLIDIDGKEIVWISHKSGSKVNDFHQWGGISLREEETIARHTETKTFVANIKLLYPNGLPPNTTIYENISDKKLKLLSMYGKDYGKSMGRNNVSLIIQGDINLVNSNGIYEIKANHIYYNGDLAMYEYQPVLMATHKGGDRSDYGIPNTRLSISPEGGRGNIISITEAYNKVFPKGKKLM